MIEAKEMVVVVNMEYGGRRMYAKMKNSEKKNRL